MLQNCFKEGDMKIYIDQNIDVKRLKRNIPLPSVEVVQCHDLENKRGIAEQVGGSFTIGASTIGGPDMIVGDNFIDVSKVIKNHNKKDILHIYSAYMNKCDYFVTDDMDEFISNRNQLEHILSPLKIVTLDELLALFL